METRSTPDWSRWTALLWRMMCGCIRLRGEAWGCGLCQRRVLPQRVADGEPGRGVRRGGCGTAARRTWRRAAQRPQGFSCPRPERADALLAALAEEVGLKRPDELGMAGPQVEELLDADARVEHHEQERVIPASLGGRAVGGLDEGTDLLGLKVLHDTRAGSLEGHGEEALAGFEVFGMSRGGKVGRTLSGRSHSGHSSRGRTPHR
jgi:hypothetical protein